MLQGQFTFDDFLEQLGTLRQMGPLQDMLEKLPFFSESMPEGFTVNEKELDRIRAIVSSMTKAERKQPKLFAEKPNRIKRVASGSGSTVKEVADLLQRFGFMQSLMGQIGQQAGFLQRMPGMKQLAMANRLRDAVKTGGLDFNPMMANLADSLLEAAVAGGPGAMMGAKGAPGARKIKVDPAKRKALRKAQKKARKKNR
jgi:signal recognition particle subunit SRP54